MKTASQRIDYSIYCYGMGWCPRLGRWITREERTALRVSTHDPREVRTKRRALGLLEQAPAGSQVIRCTPEGLILYTWTKRHNGAIVSERYEPHRRKRDRKRKLRAFASA